MFEWNARRRRRRRRIGDGDESEKETEAETNRKAKEIVQTARNEAAVVRKDAEKQLKDVTTLVAEVEAREKAVKWVKEEDARLKVKVREVAEREKAAQKLMSEASSQKDHYFEMVKSAKVHEDALADRERSLRMKKPLATPVVAAPVVAPKKRVKSQSEPKAKRGRPKKR